MRDLTQEQLAEAARISVDMLSNIERGVNAPSFETLARQFVVSAADPEPTGDGQARQAPGWSLDVCGVEV
jgi:Helix-turn-helix